MEFSKAVIPNHTPCNRVWGSDVVSDPCLCPGQVFKPLSASVFSSIKWGFSENLVEVLTWWSLFPEKLWGLLEICAGKPQAVKLRGLRGKVHQHKWYVSSLRMVWHFYMTGCLHPFPWDYFLFYIVMCLWDLKHPVQKSLIICWDFYTPSPCNSDRACFHHFVRILTG